MTFADLAMTQVELKNKLAITYVLSVHGHEVYPEGGEYVCANPFRQDDHPSFRVYASNKESNWLDRWNDFAEGKSGDVFDLIGRFEGLDSFPDRKAKAAELYQQMRDSGWDGPTMGAPKKAFDVDAAKSILLRAQIEEFIDDEHPLQQFLDARNDLLLDVPAQWLVDNFRLGEHEGRIIIPFWDRDSAPVNGYKTRYPGSRSFAAEGSQFSDVLYGEWRDDDPSRTVVLCEGETDVWAGTYVSRQDYMFLGLPTGAGAHPKQAPRLADRRVILALDADTAGRAATRKWAAALADHGAEVYIASLPDGRDLASISDVDSLLKRARQRESGIEGILEAQSTYRTVSKGNKGGHQVSDFVFNVTRVLRDELGAFTYETQYGLLPAAALITRTRFVAWCNERGVVWAGSDTDTRHLDSYLKSESVFLPTDEAVSVAGLYDGHFVWAKGSLGSRSVRFVPPVSGARVNLDIDLPEGDTDPPRQIAQLRALNTEGVTDPVLAWLAAAPVRALFPQFPILNVSGGSGSGKTTLLQTVVPALTGSNIHMNLSGTTAFAILGHAGATNAFPVVFDEFRPGAKVATLDAMATLLRDAYDSNPSTKGGGERWNELTEYQTHAPIILSGEDSLTETSHTDRSVLVRMPVGDKPTKVLEDVRKWPKDHGLARWYLGWLIDRAFRDGWSVTVHPEGSLVLNDRQRYNLGVLRIGWNLLRDFTADCGASDLLPVDPDLSMVTSEAAEAAGTNPIKDALVWANGDSRCAEYVWQEGNDLCVIVASFVAEAQRIFALPGGERAVRKYLIENYGAVHDRQRVMSQRRSFLRLPAAAVGLDDVTMEP